MDKEFQTTLYLGGANVCPPSMPAELLASVQPSADVDKMFTALVSEALKLIDRHVGADSHRSRLAHRWAAEALAILAAQVQADAADVEPYLQHLVDARDVRAAAEVWLKIAPDLRPHFLKLVTGASAMTVGRAKALLAEQPNP